MRNVVVRKLSCVRLTEQLRAVAIEHSDALCVRDPRTSGDGAYSCTIGVTCAHWQMRTTSPR
jgi:hypothetical protein